MKFSKEQLMTWAGVAVIAAAAVYMIKKNSEKSLSLTVKTPGAAQTDNA